MSCFLNFIQSVISIPGLFFKQTFENSFADLSGNNATVSRHGEVVIDNVVKQAGVGSAKLTVYDSNDYVEYPYAASLGSAEFTIECDFLCFTAQTATLFSYNTQNNQNNGYAQCRIQLNNDKSLYLLIGIGGGIDWVIITEVGQYLLGQWNHLKVQRVNGVSGNDVVRLYLNNTLIQTQNLTAGQVLSNFTGKTYLGCSLDYATPFQFFKGYIDNFVSPSINADFESSLSGGTAFGNAAVTTAQAKTGTKSLRLSPNLAYQQVAYHAGFDLSNKEFVLEMYFRVTELQSGTLLGLNGNSTGYFQVRLDLNNNGTYRLLVGGSSAGIWAAYQDGGSYSLNTWIKLQVKRDNSGVNDKVDLLVNDVSAISLAIAKGYVLHNYSGDTFFGGYIGCPSGISANIDNVAFTKSTAQ